MRSWRALWWRAVRESTDIHVLMVLALWVVLAVAFYLAVSQ